MNIFIPLSSTLLYRGDNVPGNNRTDKLHDKKPCLPMPHWSDKHTRGDECQPLVRKETAVPRGSIRSSKRNTCFEIHAQLKVHMRGAFFLLNILRGKIETRDWAARSSEKSVHIYRTTRRHIPGDSNLHN